MKYPVIKGIYDSEGERIGRKENWGAGLDYNARIEHVATYTGVHYIVAGQMGSWDEFDETYTLEAASALRG